MPLGGFGYCMTLAAEGVSGQRRLGRHGERLSRPHVEGGHGDGPHARRGSCVTACACRPVCAGLCVPASVRPVGGGARRLTALSGGSTARGPENDPCGAAPSRRRAAEVVDVPGLPRASRVRTSTAPKSATPRGRCFDAGGSTRYRFAWPPPLRPFCPAAPAVSGDPEPGWPTMAEGVPVPSSRARTVQACHAPPHAGARPVPRPVDRLPMVPPPQSSHLSPPGLRSPDDRRG